MAHPIRLSFLSLCLAGTALSGCEMGPDFHSPHAATPAAFIQDQPPAETSPYVSGDPVDPNWWQSFNDPELTKLETLAVAGNLDLQIATQRLLEAQAQAVITGAVLYPSISGAGSYTREGPSKEGIFTALGGSSSAGAATNASTVAGGTAGSIGGGGASGSAIHALDLYQYGLQSMYDLDLWGKNRRAVEAAVAAAQASVEARRAALLNVEASLASDYIQLRGTETVLDITQKNLKSADQLVSLTSEREEAGLTTELDVANAKATRAQIASQIPALTASRDGFIDQIGMLLGSTPQILPAELVTPSAVPLTPPSVPIGLPADVLRNRPDIREAEANLHEATAETGVAIASFFPDISLSGSVSLQALQFKNLNEFKAITYAVGPEITVPLFEGGQLKGQLQLRRASQTEAALNYAKTVLTAFYQVDTALVTYNQEHATLDQLGIDTAQSKIALGLAEDQYRQGLADYLSVLNAQQTYLSAQQNQAQAVEQLSNDLVTLYQALGGGWQAYFPDQHAQPDAQPEPPPAIAGAPATPVAMAAPMAMPVTASAPPAPAMPVPAAPVDASPSVPLAAAPAVIASGVER